MGVVSFRFVDWLAYAAAAAVWRPDGSPCPALLLQEVKQHLPQEKEVGGHLHEDRKERLRYSSFLAVC